jgi:tetratricopeptide (TPR) repeat protein
VNRLPEWSRRDFLRSTGLAGFAFASGGQAQTPAGASFPVELRKPGPYESLRRYIAAGNDEYACEKEAILAESLLEGLRQSRPLPLARAFSGSSPLAARFTPIDDEIAEAVFDPANRDFEGGLRQWLASLGTVRDLRYYSLAAHRVRVEASGFEESRLHYRVAHWHMEWDGGKLAKFQPLDETRVTRPEAMFTDISAQLLGGSAAFRSQLTHGSPYWRSRLDSACGIDIYGSNGISAADIDNDGWDEIYVCQPGGLPNRLFKRRADGTFDDIAAHAGLDLLDDTSCALFLDFRNAGVQDVVVLMPTGPLYLLNDGSGKFRPKKDAFLFASEVQGAFTGISAADFDRDGNVDLYLCTYVYFQSEDRYRYPAPYHDARNGPPNFLFRNRMGADGSGQFEDVTVPSGIDQNNNRYSFTASWCDYDGSGWPSLYVVNDFGRNNLYRNSNGRFRDVAVEAGVEDMGPGMCGSWFDYDGDGRPDLYVANMWTAAGQRVVADPAFPHNSTREMQEAWRRHTMGNSLFRNRGDGTFEEVPDGGGAMVGRWGWGSEGIDFDNDGAPEIFASAGMLTNSRTEDLGSFFWRRVVAKSPMREEPAPDYESGWNSINQYIREEYSWNGREPNLFYVRRGGRFRDCSGVSGLDFAADTRTFAVTDFDGDGNLDLFVKTRLGPQVRAMRNCCGVARNSIAFTLRGIKSNRDAIGAIVEVECGGRRFRRALQAGSGYLSQHTKRLLFGLERERTVTRVKISWPSGLQQVLENLEAGHAYAITEGSPDIQRTAFQPRRPIRTLPVAGDDSVRMEPTWLLEPVPLPDRRKGPGFLLLTGGTDSAPAGVPVEILNLARSAPEIAASYSLFRRYVFDWRAPLTLPLTILIDAEGRANKIYPGIPSLSAMRTDLAAQEQRERAELALPFPGWYLARPSRNHYKLGAAFIGAGYPEQALPYLEAAVRQWPQNFHAWLALGQVHLESGRLPEARRNLAKALQLNAKSPQVWNNLGGVAIAEGRNDEALRCFEQMRELAPDSLYGLTNAAMALTRLDRKAEAETLYRRALGIDPRDSETADNLGLLLGKQGRLGEAVELFKQALEGDPRNGSAINNLSVAYLQSGKTNDAVAALQYGIRVAPDYDILYLNLARLYVGMGNRDRAKQVLQALLERMPQNLAGRKALQQLGEP